MCISGSKFITILCFPYYFADIHPHLLWHPGLQNFAAHQSNIPPSNLPLVEEAVLISYTKKPNCTVCDLDGVTLGSPAIYSETELEFAKALTGVVKDPWLSGPISRWVWP